MAVMLMESQTVANYCIEWGTSHANGNITSNNFPYIYFEGIQEVTRTSTRLRFYKTGRYYGNVTEADRAAGIRMEEILPIFRKWSNIYG